MKVWVIVGRDGKPSSGAGRIYTFTNETAAMRHAFGRETVAKATLTLTSGKPRKKNSGGPARPKGTK